MCAMLVLHVLYFWSKENMLQCIFEVMCALLDLYVIGFEVKKCDRLRKLSRVRIMGEQYSAVLEECFLCNCLCTCVTPMCQKLFK